MSPTALFALATDVVDVFCCRRLMPATFFVRWMWTSAYLSAFERMLIVIIIRHFRRICISYRSTWTSGSYASSELILAECPIISREMWNTEIPSLCNRSYTEAELPASHSSRSYGPCRRCNARDPQTPWCKPRCLKILFSARNCGVFWPFYPASACYACETRYCFINSVRPSVGPMAVGLLCLSECTHRHTF